MSFFKSSRFVAAALVCWMQSASALQVIPVECVVELVKNDVVMEQHAGPCSYSIPFVVTPSTRRSFPVGYASGRPITKEISPGFRATVYVGNNLTEQNLKTNLTVDYALLEFIEARKLKQFVGDNTSVDLEMPSTRETISGGSSVFQKGEIRRIGAWSEAEDMYQVRIGIR